MTRQLTGYHIKLTVVCSIRMGFVGSIHGFNINAQSPAMISYQWVHDQKQVMISFDRVGRGLQTFPGELIQGFTLTGYPLQGGKEVIFGPSAVKIYRDTVLISYPEKYIPTSIKYAWAPYPENNVVNSSGLPLAPFKIELDGNN